MVSEFPFAWNILCCLTCLSQSMVYPHRIQTVFNIRPTSTLLSCYFLLLLLISALKQTYRCTVNCIHMNTPITKHILSHKNQILFFHHNLRLKQITSLIAYLYRTLSKYILKFFRTTLAIYDNGHWFDLKWTGQFEFGFILRYFRKNPIATRHPLVI